MLRRSPLTVVFVVLLVIILVLAFISLNTYLTIHGVWPGCFASKGFRCEDHIMNGNEITFYLYSDLPNDAILTGSIANTGWGTHCNNLGLAGNSQNLILPSKKMVPVNLTCDPENLVYGKLRVEFIFQYLIQNISSGSEGNYANLSVKFIG